MRAHSRRPRDEAVRFATAQRFARVSLKRFGSLELGVRIGYGFRGGGDVRRADSAAEHEAEHENAEPGFVGEALEELGGEAHAGPSDHRVNHRHALIDP